MARTWDENYVAELQKKIEGEISKISKEPLAVPYSQNSEEIESLNSGNFRMATGAIMFAGIQNYPRDTLKNSFLTLNFTIQQIMQIIKDWGGISQAYNMNVVMGSFVESSEANKLATDALGNSMTMLFVLEQYINPVLQKKFSTRLTLNIGMDLGEILLGQMGVPKKSFLIAFGPSSTIALEFQRLAQPNQIILGDQLYQALPESWKEYCSPLPFDPGWRYRYRESGLKYPYYKYTGRWASPISSTLISSQEIEEEKRP
jgi:hypothetical protein